MHSLIRYIHPNVSDDLNHKMVFIGGPRQVGKTTFSLSYLNPSDATNPAYLNWDDLESKKIIKSGHFPADHKLLIFDEIHKFKNWRNLIKGFYDKQKSRHQFIITGSARLDYYRRGGDSLLGRYHYYRLHPYSLTEISAQTKSDIDHLLNFGGFPEPFHRGSQVFKKRWQVERNKKIIFEDVRDLEKVQEISLMDELLEKIPPTVGSLLSYQGLANDIEINIKTIQKWIQIFDNLYLTFRVKPYVHGKLRLVKKAHRIYFWDWSYLEDTGARFENFVASHLLKYCHFMEDTQGERMELTYLRDVDGHEIDFVVLKNKKPIFAVECKVGERSVSPNIYYFKERMNIPYYYQVHLGNKHFIKEDNVEVIPFINFCKKIGIP